MDYTAKAEEARQRGDRKEFLRLTQLAEDQRYNELQANHKKQVEAAKKEFPVGMYIPELRTSVEAITDGCGTQSGWIAFKLSGREKTMDLNDIKREISKAKRSASITEYFLGLKCPKTGQMYIGQYDEILDSLKTYMEMDKIWTLEECQDNNLDGGYDTFDYVRKQAIEEGYTDQEAEDKGNKARDKAADEDFQEYRGKYIQMINYLLKYADLELEEDKKSKFYLVPLTSWLHSADKMAEVISGYGTFEYASGKELKDVGPYKTYSQAVIDHLHWLKHGPEIYGDRSYSRLID